MTTAAASKDKRQLILEATIKKNQARPEALIAILHKAQELYGFLDKPVLWKIAKALQLPASRVLGVATFYHLFSLKPQGQHTCVVCLGTACFVKGAQQLVDAAAELGGIKPGETTADGCYSLVLARCIGACGIAPAVVLDQQTVGHISTETLTARLQEWKNGSR